MAALNAAPVTIVNNDETCCFCGDEVLHLNTYYRPPCSHLYCYTCMDQHAQLNRCMRCNQVFMIAEPVRTYRRDRIVEIDDDDDEPAEQADPMVEDEDLVIVDADGVVYFNGVMVEDV